MFARIFTAVYATLLVAVLVLGENEIITESTMENILKWGVGFPLVAAIIGGLLYVLWFWAITGNVPKWMEIFGGGGIQG